MVKGCCSAALSTCQGVVWASYFGRAHLGAIASIDKLGMVASLPERSGPKPSLRGRGPTGCIVPVNAAALPDRKSRERPGRSLAPAWVRWRSGLWGVFLASFSCHCTLQPRGRRVSSR